MSRTAPDISLDTFRGDQEDVAAQGMDDPYAR